MKPQTLSDPQPAPDASGSVRSGSPARRINRQQIQALLGDDTTVTSAPRGGGCRLGRGCAGRVGRDQRLCHRTSCRFALAQPEHAADP
jgi:hypothetical protein